MLPNETLSRPPIAGPARSAICSVALRTQSASTATPTAPDRNTTGDGAATNQRSTGATGTTSSSNRLRGIGERMNHVFRAGRPDETDGVADGT